MKNSLHNELLNILVFSHLQGTGLWYEIGVRVAEEPILTHVVAVQELVVSQSQPNYLACQTSKG